MSYDFYGATVVGYGIPTRTSGLSAPHWRGRRNTRVCAASAAPASLAWRAAPDIVEALDPRRPTFGPIEQLFGRIKQQPLLTFRNGMTI